MLDCAFKYCASIAEQTGVLQPTNAAPDDGFLSSVVPMYSAKNLTAFATDDYLSKAVVAAESSGLTVRAGVDDSAADKFLLHLHEDFTRDGGFMAVFYIILGNDAVILDSLFREEIDRICFL